MRTFHFQVRKNIDEYVKWMKGIKRIEKIRNEEIRARAGVVNKKKIREARLRERLTKM